MNEVKREKKEKKKEEKRYSQKNPGRKTRQCVDTSKKKEWDDAKKGKKQMGLGQDWLEGYKRGKLTTCVSMSSNMREYELIRRR